ncbi:hypothetical protein [Corynebacterium sp. A21]|uniref:hypothetical protein n=1 Tax=Corynebacterium sp. A21 TaxID=3457318 RepID=UPI003FD55B54
MPLTTIQTQITELTDGSFAELRRWLGTEDARRRQRRAEHAGQAEIISELRDSGAIENPAGTDGGPATWANPGTLHQKMYLHCDIVAHVGRVWMSTHPGQNHWEPGAVGIDHRIWLDVTPTSEDEVTGA